MKKIILIPIILCTITLFAQEKNTDLQKQQQEIVTLIQKLNIQQVEFSKHESELAKLSSKAVSHEKEIESLKSKTTENVQNIQTIANDLGTKIQQTEITAKDRISKLDKDLNTNRLYWIIATLVTLMLGGLIYWLLGKRIASSQIDVESQIRNTKKSLEEESLKLDAQLLDIINSQLKIKETEPTKTESGEKDHSLVLKVADEVTRILMNLEVMDKEIKGYKQLKKYSESILDNLKAYGYEIPQLIGMNYNSGMNMVATLEFDESIEAGRQIIKRIIKPQVNFEGKMIQAAKVTVAFNE
jgi:hypothetical protein